MQFLTDRPRVSLVGPGVEYTQGFRPFLRNESDSLQHRMWAFTLLWRVDLCDHFGVVMDNGIESIKV